MAIWSCDIQVLRPACDVAICSIDFYILSTLLVMSGCPCHIILKEGLPVLTLILMWSVSLYPKLPGAVVIASYYRKHLHSCSLFESSKVHGLTANLLYSLRCSPMKKQIWSCINIITSVFLNHLVYFLLLDITILIPKGANLSTNRYVKAVSKLDL